MGRKTHHHGFNSYNIRPCSASFCFGQKKPSRTLAYFHTHIVFQVITVGTVYALFVQEGTLSEIMDYLPGMKQRVGLLIYQTQHSLI